MCFKESEKQNAEKFLVPETMQTKIKSQITCDIICKTHT